MTVKILKQTKRYMLVMELVDGNSLLTCINERKRSFTLNQIAVIMKQVVASVQHMHSRGMVHRDIKPENIMIQGNCDVELPEIKLVDFGAATLLEQGQYMREPAGTLAFMAPEMLAKEDLYG